MQWNGGGGNTAAAGSASHRHPPLRSARRLNFRGWHFVYLADALMQNSVNFWESGGKGFAREPSIESTLLTLRFKPAIFQSWAQQPNRLKYTAPSQGWLSELHVSSESLFWWPKAMGLLCWDDLAGHSNTAMMVCSICQKPSRPQVPTLRMTIDLQWSLAGHWLFWRDLSMSCCASHTQVMGSNPRELN